MAAVYPPPEPTPEELASASATEADANLLTSTTDETAPQEPLESEVEIPQEEGRFRRFLRRLVRALAVIVLLLGAGFLLTYFLLARPAQQQLTQIQSRLEQAQRDLSSAETRVAESEGQVKNMQTQVEQARAEVEKAQNLAALQKVRTDIAVARLALANRDGPAARVALVQAQNDLAQLLPALKAADEGLANSVSGRLDIILNELNRDPTTAISDMDILSRNLDQAEKALGVTD